MKSTTYICIFSTRPYRNTSPFIQRESQKILFRDMLIWSHLWKLNVCDHLNDHFLCFPTREKWTSASLLLQVHQTISKVHPEIRMQCTENAYIPFLCLQIIWWKYTEDPLAAWSLNPHFLRSRNQKKIQVPFHQMALFKSKVSKDKSPHTLPAGRTAQGLCQLTLDPQGKNIHVLSACW